MHNAGCLFGFESLFLPPRRVITKKKTRKGPKKLCEFVIKMRKVQKLMCELAFLICTVFLSLAVVICNAKYYLQDMLYSLQMRIWIFSL